METTAVPGDALNSISEEPERAIIDVRPIRNWNRFCRSRSDENRSAIHHRSPVGGVNDNNSTGNDSGTVVFLVTRTRKKFRKTFFFHTVLCYSYKIESTDRIKMIHSYLIVIVNVYYKRPTTRKFKHLSTGQILSSLLQSIIQQ